jgi:hypothetical protein
MKINEVLTEVNTKHSDASKQMRDLHIQKRISGVAVDTKNVGKQMGTSAATGVEVGDLANVADKGQKDTDLGKVDTSPITDKRPQKQSDGPSSADLRRQAQQDVLRGRTGRTGIDGRELKHDRFYGKDGQVKDYDTILSRPGRIKDAGKTLKKYAANFVRDPANTMADLRYKFKDLLQK